MLKKLFNDEDAQTDTASMIVKVAGIFLIGVMILSAIAGSTGNSIEDGTKADGTIEVNGLPNDAETINVTFDGTEETYEFDSDGSSNVTSDYLIDIGSNESETNQNIIDGLNTNTAFKISASDGGSNTTYIEYDEKGTEGNEVSFTDDVTNVIVPSSLSGGEDSDAFYGLMDTVKNNVTTGYGLGALMILVIGASAIMRYLGFM